MKHLYFMRHGLTEHNVSGHWSGHTDSKLTAEGKKQAKDAGIVAKDLKIDHIVCSPLSRAVDSATILAKEIGFPIDKIEQNSLFIERHFGVLEGQPHRQDVDLDGITDIETSDTIINRARLAFEYLESIKFDAILVVSHGTFGRAIRHVIYPDIPFDPMTDATRLKNAEIIKLI